MDGQVVSAFGNSLRGHRHRYDARHRSRTRLGRRLRNGPASRSAASRSSSSFRRTTPITWRGASGPRRRQMCASISSTRATAASSTTSAISRRRGAVAQGNGVLGDLKKLSVSPSGGQFVTTDRLRPPAINTYDMRGDYVRAINYLNGVIDLTPSDLGDRRRQRVDRFGGCRRAMSTPAGPTTTTSSASAGAGWTTAISRSSA